MHPDGRSLRVRDVSERTVNQGFASEDAVSLKTAWWKDSAHPSRRESRLDAPRSPDQPQIHQDILIRPTVMPGKHGERDTSLSYSIGLQTAGLLRHDSHSVRGMDTAPPREGARRPGSSYVLTSRRDGANGATSHLGSVHVKNALSDPSLLGPTNDHVCPMFRQEDEALRIAAVVQMRGRPRCPACRPVRFVLLVCGRLDSSATSYIVSGAACQ